MGFKEELLRRAQEYTEQHGLAVGDELGCGVHGIVFDVNPGNISFAG
jgi:hypothetical protein